MAVWILVLVVAFVLLLRLDILPISFGATWGFKDHECDIRKVSEVSHVVTCQREILEYERLYP